MECILSNRSGGFRTRFGQSRLICSTSECSDSSSLTTKSVKGSWGLICRIWFLRTSSMRLRTLGPIAERRERSLADEEGSRAVPSGSGSGFSVTLILYLWRV